MAISNPPITDDPNLNFILFEIIRELNEQKQNYNRLLQDIRESATFAELQARIDT
jgi:hypothetical protein